MSKDQIALPTFAEIYRINTSKMPPYNQSSVDALASELDKLIGHPRRRSRQIDEFDIDDIYGDSNRAEIRTYAEDDGSGIHPVARFKFPIGADQLGLLLISATQPRDPGHVRKLYEPMSSLYEPGKRLGQPEELKIGFTGTLAGAMAPTMAERLGVPSVFRFDQSIVKLSLPESETGLTKEAAVQFKTTFGLGLEALKSAIKAKKIVQAEAAA